ncbi:hypothetical protein [Inquilinus sp. OTU3971]|uniref:hypothetical protein n=1 Tax=Inquilinus sp. OTU3971 TaxID=3043855 RepID=UPI00313DD843
MIERTRTLGAIARYDALDAPESSTETHWQAAAAAARADADVPPSPSDLGLDRAGSDNAPYMPVETAASLLTLLNQRVSLLGYTDAPPSSVESTQARSDYLRPYISAYFDRIKQAKPDDLYDAVMSMLRQEYESDVGRIGIGTLDLDNEPELYSIGTEAVHREVISTFLELTPADERSGAVNKLLQDDYSQTFSSRKSGRPDPKDAAIDATIAQVAMEKDIPFDPIRQDPGLVRREPGHEEDFRSALPYQRISRSFRDAIAGGATTADEFRTKIKPAVEAWLFAVPASHRRDFITHSLAQFESQLRDTAPLLGKAALHQIVSSYINQVPPESRTSEVDYLLQQWPGNNERDVKIDQIIADVASEMNIAFDPSKQNRLPNLPSLQPK